MSATVVVGFGVSGQAVAAALAKQGVPEVIVIEDHPAPDAPARAAELGARLVAAPDRSSLAAVIAGAGEVVVSPGVPPSHPVYELAHRDAIPLFSEIELAWRRLDSRPGSSPKLLAITGTNGKTTVATWTAGILAAAGQRVSLAGNIGFPLIRAIDQLPDEGRGTDVIVAEVSSFQLQYSARFRPSVSCWLNLAEDHLDWHATMADYVSAKSRIWANQGAGDTAVVNAGDQAVVAAARHVPPGVAVLWYTSGVKEAGRPDAFVDDGQRLLAPGGEAFMDIEELPRRLPHDRTNALAAAAVAWAGGADLDACRRGLVDASALPHRVQLVADVGGVAWYDDSKATTPASVRAAVAGFRSVVLIAGGRNKGLDLSTLGSLAPPVRAVIAIGEAAEAVIDAFSGRVPAAVAADMAEAVRIAAATAHPGDTVLLSPGCASFDWYRSYAERGNHFAELVRRAVLAPARTRGQPGTPEPPTEENVHDADV